MKRVVVFAAAVLSLAACRKESPLKPMTTYESADLQAAVFDFQVYPGARFLDQETQILRRAHFVIHPDAKSAPPMAMYDSDASLDAVAEFYAQKYGYGTVAPEGTPNAPAFFVSGDLANDAKALQPILAKLKLGSDVTKVHGAYRGAHISATKNFPRVSLQRPYFEFSTGAVVDRTLITMVKE